MLEMDLEALPVARTDFDDESSLPSKTIIAQFKSGVIYTESGSDGTWILFDCDCLDALPYCRAHCCTLRGIVLEPAEYAKGIYDAAVWNDEAQMVELKRNSDGRCEYLDRRTCKCTIYEDRPATCQKFHCTRGAQSRGFPLPNAVYRHSNT